MGIQVPETRTRTHYLLHSRERCYRHAVLSRKLQNHTPEKDRELDRHSACVDPSQHVEQDRDEEYILAEGRRPARQQT